MNVYHLVALAPDPVRAERVRASCQARLARSRRRGGQMAAMGTFTWRVLAPAVVGAFGLLYSIALIATTLGLRGVFQ